MLRLSIIFTLLTWTDGSSKFDVNRLRRFAEAAMACSDIRGLAVAAVTRDRTIFTGGYGVRGVDGRSKNMTKSSLLGIGSNTKSFTSTLAAMAVDEGNMAWETPLKSYFGDNFKLQSDYRTEHTNLVDVLSHRTGMLSLWGLTTAAPNYTLQELVSKLQYFPVQYEFRSRYLYSNYGVTLGGAAVEAAMNKTWEDLLKERVFDKLGMTSSRPATRMEQSDWSRTAFAQTLYGDGKFRENDEPALVPMYAGICPAGCIYSSAQDMAKWLRFHLNQGVTEKGERVFAADSLLETYSWVFLPGSGVGAWVGSTSPGYGRQTTTTVLITNFILDLLLGVEPWLNETTVCSYPHGVKFPRPPQPIDPPDILDPISTPSSPPSVDQIIIGKRGSRRSSFAEGDVRKHGEERDAESERFYNSSLESTTLNDEEDERSFDSITFAATDEEGGERSHNSTTFTTADNEEDDGDKPRSPSVSARFLTSKVTEHFMNASQTLLKDYVGSYKHPGFGTWSVELNGTVLHYKFGLLLSGQLTKTSTRDCFHQSVSPPQAYRMEPHGSSQSVIFHRGNDGTVSSIEVPYLEYRSPPVFVKA
ncbi:uncharacterized protein LOC101847954 [Aplysia californica]|uniref:Uncharacterized protein LOC101847954 n=1 Tax=Aplysia californica TaxID=6500 RepID=A0ABM0ZYZ3_APLCA|nr:uncharacterized protein LOC101847954 [Aplysia californica]